MPPAPEDGLAAAKSSAKSRARRGSKATSLTSCRLARVADQRLRSRRCAASQPIEPNGRIDVDAGPRTSSFRARFRLPCRRSSCSGRRCHLVGAVASIIDARRRGPDPREHFAGQDFFEARHRLRRRGSRRWWPWTRPWSMTLQSRMPSGRAEPWRSSRCCRRQPADRLGRFGISVGRWPRRWRPVRRDRVRASRRSRSTGV